MTRFERYLWIPGLALAAVALGGCPEEPASEGTAATSAAVRSRESARTPAVPTPSTAAGALPAVAGDTGAITDPTARNSLLVGSTLISFDSTTMAAAFHVLGAAPAFVKYESPYFYMLDACYSASEGASRVTLRLTTAGNVEVDTLSPDRAAALLPLSSVVMERGDEHVEQDEDSPPCAPLRPTPAELRLGNGLRLEMTRAEVERRLGPGRRDEESGDWVYACKHPDAYRTSTDPSNQLVQARDPNAPAPLRVRYRNEVAVRIRAMCDAT